MTDNRTTELTATDRLRAMLDERSVEWVEGQENPDLFTGWHASNGEKAAVHETHGKLYLVVNGIEPEQAIAATLGSGTLTAEQVREAVERHVKFYEGGDYDEQAIADELNAELGSGTCEWTPADYITEGDWWNTECGESFTWEPDGTPNCCPNCGRKVVTR